MPIYKPGTTKPLSPRTGDYSVRWGKLVLSRVGIDNPPKAVKTKIVELWRLGYSHKDAAIAISGMV